MQQMTELESGLKQILEKMGEIDAVKTKQVN